MKKALPWIVLGLVLLLAAVQLRMQGRLWFCACGYVVPWSGNINSSDNSQQLFDPYSFTHILHGFMLIGIARLLGPELPRVWQFVFTLSMEAMWEIIENTSFIINRYRSETVSLGYMGDSIVNSFGDIAACGLGALLAYKLGFRRTVIVFVITEAVLLVWIRDGLVLNILMLLYPLEAIKVWQSGH